MKLNQLNSWLNLIANIGVLAGIVFLAIEINQSNLQAQSATYQARTNEIENSQREFALSETLPMTYIKLNESGVDSLTPLEFSRVYNWEQARISRLQSQFHHYQLGFLDDASYNTMMEVGTRNLSLWKELGISTVYAELISLFEEAQAEGLSYERREL